MAAVCKFRGDIFFFGLVPSVAQLSSVQPFLIYLNDLLDNVTCPLLTKQKPRKCDKNYRHMERHFDIMTTYALRAAAVKMVVFAKN